MLNACHYHRRVVGVSMHVIIVVSARQHVHVIIVVVGVIVLIPEARLDVMHAKLSSRQFGCHLLPRHDSSETTTLSTGAGDSYHRTTGRAHHRSQEGSRVVCRYVDCPPLSYE